MIWQGLVLGTGIRRWPIPIVCETQTGATINCCNKIGGTGRLIWGGVSTNLADCPQTIHWHQLGLAGRCLKAQYLRRSMGSSLITDRIWSTITSAARSDVGDASVAVAYFGAGASKLLPLKRGSRLVVDFSERAVKSGQTCPSEILKLIKLQPHLVELSEHYVPSVVRV